MRYRVNCPHCGSYGLELVQRDDSWLSYETHMRCLNCRNGFTEAQVLKHMREKPYIDRNAPAFRKLDRVKPKAVSEAARTIFGTVGGQ